MCGSLRLFIWVPSGLLLCWWGCASSTIISSHHRNSILSITGKRFDASKISRVKCPWKCSLTSMQKLYVENHLNPTVVCVSVCMWVQNYVILSSQELDKSFSIALNRTPDTELKLCIYLIGQQHLNDLFMCRTQCKGISLQNLRQQMGEMFLK